VEIGAQKRYPSVVVPRLSQSIITNQDYRIELIWFGYQTFNWIENAVKLEFVTIIWKFQCTYFIVSGHDNHLEWFLTLKSYNNIVQNCSLKTSHNYYSHIIHIIIYYNCTTYDILLSPTRHIVLCHRNVSCSIIYIYIYII